MSVWQGMLGSRTQERGMSEERIHHTARRQPSEFLRYLIVITALLMYGLIVLGGFVRTTYGPGCPDWPLCYGHVLPPSTFSAWLDWVHRFVASIVGIFLVSATALAWAELTITHPVTRYLALTVPLLLVESGLGGLAVIRELPSQVVALHLALSLLILALVLLATVRAFLPLPVARKRSPLARVVDIALLLVYVFILTGALVTTSGAAWACQKWPLCEDGVWPANNPPALINVVHRYMALVIGGVLGLLVYRAWQDKRVQAPARQWSTIAAGLFLLGGVLGAVTVWLGFPPLMNALHLAVAAAMWGSLVLASAYAYQPVDDTLPVKPARPTRRKERAPRAGWRAYLGLMKPGIVLLLVITTVGGMSIAARGWPEWDLFLWTVIASILSAGGANALNSYQDRDIDGRMSRTARRPLPQNLVPPRNAMIFGLACVIAGVLIMAWKVNLLTAALTLVGAIWYAGVYTRLLKRRTVQNIVIGGAAGAMAPVVGWTAVTGRVDFLALILFALIFLWTPPHTWAFAILVLKDYEKVGIPMLPVVKGLDETTRQVVFYSWLMVGVTLLPAFTGTLGRTYLVGMLILNVLFLYLAYRLRREPTKATANRLYQYSNAYLYLGFALMAFDRMGGLL